MGPLKTFIGITLPLLRDLESFDLTLNTSVVSTGFHLSVYRENLGMDFIKKKLIYLKSVKFN